MESTKDSKSRPNRHLKKFKNIKKNPHAHKVLPKFESELREFLSIFENPDPSEPTSPELNVGDLAHEDVGESWDHLTTETYTDVKIEHEADLDAILVSAARVEPHHLDPEVKVSVKAVSNSFHRLLIHTLCEYYNIISYSRNEPQGYRSIVICQPGVSLNNDTRLKRIGWSYPTKLFCDFLFT